jgi:hypothetical protein
MKTIYNALYLSIFLHFLRVILAKFIFRGNGMYNLYLVGCERKNRKFTVLVASLPDMAIIKHMANYLDGYHWEPTIAMDGCFFPREVCEIIPISDPELKDLFCKEEYSEITGALKFADGGME